MAFTLPKKNEKKKEEAIAKAEEFEANGYYKDAILIYQQLLSSGTDSETTSGDHSGHMWGNIGVMSTQDMLQQELDIQRFNLIQQITDLFLTEFCIMVY